MRPLPLTNHALRRRLKGGKHIVVLLHEGQAGKSLAPYSIARLLPVWVGDGHQVSLAYGPRRVPQGDLLFLHVDLSVVPQDYREVAARFPVAINARIVDIRKSRTSTHLLQRGSAWDGPVIVKSDLNFGGEPERRLLGLTAARPLVQADGSTLHACPLAEYEVYARLAEVPDAHWRHPGLVVERFLPERHGELYQLRTCHVLGEDVQGYVHRSPHPLVKGSTVVERLEVAPHPGVLARRRELGLDYGKLDYVVHGDEAIVLDVNKTTGGGSLAQTPALEAARLRRARALYRYWQGA